MKRPARARALDESKEQMQTPAEPSSCAQEPDNTAVAHDEKPEKRPKRRAKSKAKAKAADENPFADPPDENQARVSEMFGWKPPEPALPPPPATPPRATSAKEPSSSSSQSTSPCYPLGEMTQEVDIEDSGWLVQPEMTRTRSQMFSFKGTSIVFTSIVERRRLTS